MALVLGDVMYPSDDGLMAGVRDPLSKSTVVVWGS
jgi:hypothetical protein